MSTHRISVKRSRRPRKKDWLAFLPVSTFSTVLFLSMVYIVVSVYRDGLTQNSDMAPVRLGSGQDLHTEKSNLALPQLHLFEANASGRRSGARALKTNTSAFNHQSSVKDSNLRLADPEAI